MIPLSVSVGVSHGPRDGLDAEALLHQADEAMYQAKREGGGRGRSGGEPPAPLAALRGAQESNTEPLALLEREVPVRRRVLHPGDTIYRAGEVFRDLHIVRVGLCKLYSVSAEGRDEAYAATQANFHAQPTASN